jgi:hypothetical protein
MTKQFRLMRIESVRAQPLSDLTLYSAPLMLLEALETLESGPASKACVLFLMFFVKMLPNPIISKMY